MFGGRIRQARLLAGYTQEKLSEELKKWGYAATKAVISKYEKNKSAAPAQFLILAASILNVPASYFTHQPTLSVEWLAFRRHSALPSGEQAAIKQYATDVAELQIELQTLLYPNTVIDLPLPKKVETMADAEQAALELRERWQLETSPIDSLVRTVEDHSIVVIGWYKHAGEFDGLSARSHQHHPITVINISTEVATDRRRFTLAHELGHLVMDTSSVSEAETEKLAHRFAASFLVPAERAKYELGTRRTNIDWDELKILKRKYGLSMSAWVHRAQELDIITKHYAITLHHEIVERGWRIHEPVEYIREENPLKLEQMAYRAVAEGLMSPDQIRRAYPRWMEAQTETETDRFTIYDLLKLPEEEQKRIMDESFKLAATVDYEIFEADDFLEDYEGLN